MGMIRPRFLSDTDRRELLACVKRQREDHGVARRANALLLLDEGKSCVAVAQVLYLDDDTVRGWHKQYVAEGWDSVAYDGWKGGKSRMMADQEAALCAWLEGRFCRSTVEVRAYWAATLGLRYSHSGCVKLLARLGFEYRKPRPCRGGRMRPNRLNSLTFTRIYSRRCPPMRPYTLRMQCTRNTKANPPLAG